MPTSVTLYDLERRISPDFVFFTEFDSFAGLLYVKILSPTPILPLLAKTNAHCSAVYLR